LPDQVFVAQVARGHRAVNCLAVVAVISRRYKSSDPPSRRLAS
jgi:hypothetical protein